MLLSQFSSKQSTTVLSNTVATNDYLHLNLIKIK